MGFERWKLELVSTMVWFFSFDIHFIVKEEYRDKCGTKGRMQGCRGIFVTLLGHGNRNEGKQKNNEKMLRENKNEKEASQPEIELDSDINVSCYEKKGFSLVSIDFF